MIAHPERHRRLAVVPGAPGRARFPGSGRADHRRQPPGRLRGRCPDGLRGVLPTRPRSSRRVGRALDRPDGRRAWPPLAATCAATGADRRRSSSSRPIRGRSCSRSRCPRSSSAPESRRRRSSRRCRRFPGAPFARFARSARGRGADLPRPGGRIRPLLRPAAIRAGESRGLRQAIRPRPPAARGDGRPEVRVGTRSGGRNRRPGRALGRRRPSAVRPRRSVRAKRRSPPRGISCSTPWRRGPGGRTTVSFSADCAWERRGTARDPSAPDELGHLGDAAPARGRRRSRAGRDLVRPRADVPRELAEALLLAAVRSDPRAAPGACRIPASCRPAFSPSPLPWVATRPWAFFRRTPSCCARRPTPSRSRAT